MKGNPDEETAEDQMQRRSARQHGFDRVNNHRSALPWSAHAFLWQGSRPSGRKQNERCPDQAKYSAA